MITVHDRVWEEWHELERRVDEPAIVLLFTSELTSDDALAAVNQAASDAVRGLEEAFAASGCEQHRTGDWTAAPVPGGIAIRIDEEPSDFRRLVQDLAGRLETLGVEGSLDVYESQPVGELPEQTHLFECRVRVRGARHHFRGPNWRVLPEAESLTRIVEAGIDWCARNAPALPLVLKVRTMPAVVLRSEDDVRTYVRQGLDVSSEIGVVELTSAGPDRFRTLVVRPRDARVSLVEGGGIIEQSGWEPTLESLRRMLETTSEWAVYGFVKRGSHRSAATFGNLTWDWPPGLPYTPGLDDYTAAFEDAYAPDAFGVQLLGPGYAGRVPHGPDWNHIPVADRVIVEHRDPAAWFAELFVPFGGRPNYTLPPIPPVPDVLARAREDFAEILFRDEIAWQAS